VVVLEGVNKTLAAICALLTIVATLYAIRVARSTLKARKAELALVERNLCESCKNGKPPLVCPLPPEDRPKTCPLKLQ
jgi:hypothetical protein